MNIITPKEQFLKAASAIHRDGINDLIEWLTCTDFFIAPASTRFHGSHEGGLCTHSIEVWRYLSNFNTYYANCTEVEKWSDETIAIVALFHDICKVNCYKTEMRWRKDAMNRWEQYPTYKFDEDFKFGGHGSKSLYLVQNFIKLTPEEAVAINCHMGQWDATTYSNPSAAYEQYPLAWLLHVADEAASFISKM